MTKFTLSFVLGFRKHAYEGIFFTKQKKRKKLYDSLNLPKQCIICGDLSHFVHIDYTFLPKKITNSLDIIFYENMAILYASNDQQAQRTIRRGRLYWCCFTITHDVNLTEREIIKLHDSYIVMKVYNSKYRVAEKLLRIQPGIYSHESVDDSKKLFAPLYKVNIQHYTQHKWNESNVKFNVNSTPLTDFEKEAGHIHRGRAEYLINHLVQHLSIDSFTSRPPFGLKSQHVSNANVSYITPKERNSPAGTNETYLELIRSDFSFPGEMIFTDRKELLFDMNSCKNLYRGFILITVSNLLTPEQCHLLNPFLISITSIENVPVSILKQNGFERIYVQYDTPLFGAVQTNAYPIKKNINIQESRSFLTHSKDKLDLINFAQSGHIIFKVRGIRNRQSGDVGEGALFGTQDVDFKLNKPFTKSTQNLYQDLLNTNEKHETFEDRLLFIAKYVYKKSFNLGWIATTSISCTTMNNIFTACDNQFESTHKRPDYWTAINMHCCHETTNEEECFIDSRILLESQTILNLTTSIASSLSKTLLSILSTNEPLSRIGLLIYDMDVILDLLTMIYEHNSSITPTTNYNNLDCLKHCLHHSFCFKLGKHNQQYITGFYIDNGKTFYLFIEGIATGFIQVMWNKIMHFSRNVALVWYNSDLVFNERLYSGMLPHTSIYGIVLKEPIEILFRKSYAFLKGSMPIPCWTAMRKLNFLFMESTMLFTSTRGIFPTMEELISFDIEFGIPKKNADPKIQPSTSVSSG